MSKPRNYQTEAIIIKKVKLGEADRILTLFTPHLGKIRAVAKGVRRPRSKMSGHLELLNHSLVALARGRNLDTVTGCQTINSFLPLRSDLWLTSCALYVAELVEQFTEDAIENNALFQLLLETLQRLSQNNNEISLRYFEMHLLSESGYQPELYQCVACKSELAPATNAFSFSSGGMLCPSCARNQDFTYSLSVDAQKVLRLLQNDDYTAASRLKINPSLAQELDEVMRRYITYLLEREVKSVSWLDNLRTQMKAGAGTPLL